jgi:hypothetical protein
MSLARFTASRAGIIWLEPAIRALIQGSAAKKYAVVGRPKRPAIRTLAMRVPSSHSHCGAVSSKT